MASFSSGVMISKSEAERRRGDEMRMRKQGLDPNRDDLAWGGAVISRRQRRPTRVEKIDEKEREEAEALPQDLGQVLAKKPDGRLKWMQKALMLSAKGRVGIAAVYDIVTHPKFVAGVGAGAGKQMRDMLQANLHLFSTKQQRALQSESSKFQAFVGLADPSGSPEDPLARSDPDSSDDGDGGSRHRRKDARGAEDRRRHARGAADDFLDERQHGGGEPHHGCSRSRSGSRRRRQGDGARSRSRSRGAAADDDGGHRGAADDDGRRGGDPQKTGQLKIKLEPWQPHCLRAAAAAPP